MIRTIPRPALVLSAIGVAPFVVAAAVVWLAPRQWASLAIISELAYGALVLSYLGGVRWGLAIAGYGARDEAAGAGWARLSWSFVPPIIAWPTLFVLPPAPAVAVQIATFVGLYFADNWASRGGTAPAWYGPLRQPLSVIVVLSLGASLFGLPGYG